VSLYDKAPLVPKNGEEKKSKIEPAPSEEHPAKESQAGQKLAFDEARKAAEG
jgi:hypothetical protein